MQYSRPMPFAFALLAICALAFAAQFVEASSPSSGASTQSRDITFSFTFYGGENYTGQPMCAFYLDGSLQGQKRLTLSNSSSFEAKNLSRKAHEWQVSCEDAISAKRTFTILQLPPPEVALSTPANAYSTENGNVGLSFYYRSNSDELESANCSLAIGVSLRTSVIALSGAKTTIGYLLAPGTYPWMIRCARNETGKFVDSEQRVITINEKPVPKITNETKDETPANETAEPAQSQFNITVEDAQTPPVVWRLLVAEQSEIGLEVPLKLLFPNSTPAEGATITAISENGNRIALAPTDSGGRTSFLPDSIGTYVFVTEDANLSSSPSMVVIPPPPVAQNSTAPKNTPVSAAKTLDDKRNEILSSLLLPAVGMLALAAAIAAAFAFMRKPKMPPASPDGKIVLNEVK